MNILLKILKNIVIGVWIIVAIFVTVCLLSYNEFNVTVLGRNTLLVIDSDDLEPTYKEGSLIIAKRQSDNKINIGDEVFFYNGNKAKEYLISIGRVTDKEEVLGADTKYGIEGTSTSGSYIIGKTEEATVMEGLGTVLEIFQSRWGFLFLIVLPTLFAMVYEIVIIVTEFKKKEKEA